MTAGCQWYTEIITLYMWHDANYGVNEHHIELNKDKLYDTLEQIRWNEGNIYINDRSHIQFLLISFCINTLNEIQLLH